MTKKAEKKKTRKKAPAALLAAVWFFCAAILPVRAAEGTVTFGSESYEWKEEEVCPIGVYFGSSFPVSSYTVCLEYNPEVLSYLNGADRAEGNLLYLEGGGTELSYKRMLHFSPLSPGDTVLKVVSAEGMVMVEEALENEDGIQKEAVMEAVSVTQLLQAPIHVTGVPEEAVSEEEMTENEGEDIREELSDEGTSADRKTEQDAEKLLTAGSAAIQSGKLPAPMPEVEGAASEKIPADTSGDKQVKADLNGREKTENDFTVRAALVAAICAVMLLLIGLAVWTCNKVEKSGKNPLSWQSAGQRIKTNTKQTGRQTEKPTAKSAVKPAVKKKQAKKPARKRAGMINLDKTVIAVKDVTMQFKIAAQESASLKEYLIRAFKRENHYYMLNALNHVSFEVKQGEVLGIIGTNGSGKSTLLKLIAGVMRPTDGRVEVDKSKVQMLTLGTGFDMELTARENVYLNGAIIGYTKEYIDEKFEEIVAFAELEGFMDEKMKNFSSGMVSRLGFAIAVMRDTPEILILDEVLSVGDMFFRNKSEKRIKEMIHSGATVLIVSHSSDVICKNCDRVVWIEKGIMRMIGEPREVCAAYGSMRQNA